MSVYALPHLFTSSIQKKSEGNASSGEPSVTTRKRCTVGSNQRSSSIEVKVNRAQIDPIQLLLQTKGSTCTSSADSDENAPVTFELSVKQSGRSYQAKRSMASFSSLLKDLVEECRGTLENVPALPATPLQDACSENKFHSNACVPVGMLNAVGFSGRGFATMQEMWRGYVPLIEAWLVEVCDALPHSPRLMRFLWEPIEVFQSSKGLKVKRLESISEDEETCDTTVDEEEEEDYEIFW